MTSEQLLADIIKTVEARKEELGIKPNQWTLVGDDGRTVWQGCPTKR